MKGRQDASSEHEAVGVDRTAEPGAGAGSVVAAVAGAAARRGAPARGRALGVEDWLAAANTLLASENIHGVQISALCQKLGVTKGSFYWHFPNRAGLLRAMLDDWRRRMTLGVVSRLTRSATDAATRLRDLLSLPRRAFSAPATAVEMSVREWGRRDGTTRRAVQEVDLIRLKFFEQGFAELGFAPAQARTRAYLAYALMMGDSVLRDTLGDQVDDEALVDTACALLSTQTEPGSTDFP